MNLDIRTTMMIAAVLALIIGASLQFALRDYPASILPSIRLWVLGTLLLPTAWMLYGLRDNIPDFLSIVVANGLLGLAFAKQVEALRCFMGHPDNRVLIFAPVAAIVLCECLFTYAVPSMNLRGVTVSAIISAQLWCAVAALVEHGRPRHRSHLLTAAAFATLALALMGRVVNEVFQDQKLPAPFAPSPMQTVVFGLAAAFPIAGTLGFLLMCNDRLYQALARNQERLRAITDNLPTIVAHIDTNQRFTFANEYLGQLLGVNPEWIVGRTMLEVLGPTIYDEVKLHVSTVLRGDAVTFDMERNFRGEHRYFEASYVPDVESGHTVRGFYVLIFDISRLKHAELELARQAQHDNLTGLANRSKFDELLKRALARTERNGRSLGLLYIDIDHFKKINDTFGHAIGDAVLREFATRLEGSLRETDLAARLGGDEFAVLIEDINPSDAPENVARKLLAVLKRDFVVEEANLKISASIGIGVARGDTDAKSLLRRADSALYEAKAAGRNTYCVATVG
ncbi:MAG: GGDEF domain-containing protein [Rudaea sp.]|nr:GGDEF domain-containing protein [Rudaea sp.]